MSHLFKKSSISVVSRGVRSDLITRCANDISMIFFVERKPIVVHTDMVLECIADLY